MTILSAANRARWGYTPDLAFLHERAMPIPKTKLLMLEQWCAGLRLSEAYNLEVRDLSLDTPNPTIRVSSGHDDFGEGVNENTLGGWSQVRSRLAHANATSQLPHP